MQHMLDPVAHARNVNVMRSEPAPERSPHTLKHVHLFDTHVSYASV